MKKLFIGLGLVTALISFYLIWSLFINPKNNIQALNSNITPITTEVSFADKQLQSMSLRQKIASLLILHISGTDTLTINSYLNTYQPGGLIFMADNIPTTSDELSKLTSKLQDGTNLPYLLAIDQEGGVVRRIMDDNYPAAIELKSQPPELTQSAFNNRSILLNRLGINLNFGIVADVTDDPASFIYSRSFGGDPKAAGDRVAAAVKGAKGLTLSTLKHYPGHGETNADSHFNIPSTNISYTDWQQKDEIPFKEGVESGAQVIMFGHLIYSSIDTQPASLSKKWHEILKKNCNFNGITITDDMIMLQQSNDPTYDDAVENAVNALKAGNTMLLYVTDHGGGLTNIDPNTLIDGIASAVENGSLDKNIINQNAKQIIELRHDLPTILKSNKL